MGDPVSVPMETSSLHEEDPPSKSQQDTCTSIVFPSVQQVLCSVEMGAALSRAQDREAAFYWAFYQEFCLLLPVLVIYCCVTNYLQV